VINSKEETIAPRVLKASKNCDSAVQLDDGQTILTVEPLRGSQKQKLEKTKILKFSQNPSK
jgi:hypothetical protein